MPSFTATETTPSSPIRSRMLFLQFNRVSAIVALIFSFILFVAPVAVSGQDEGDEAKSEELKRLEALKAEAQAREAIAKAKKAELDARFPQSSSSPLEGKTTVPDKLIEEHIGGYMSVGEAADEIARVIKTRTNLDVIAIYNESDMQLLLVYDAATRRITTYRSRFNSVTQNQKLALKDHGFWVVPTTSCDEGEAQLTVEGLGGSAFNPLSIATSLLGGFGDVLSFFRTNVEIKGSTFNVDESVIVTEVFRALRDNKRLALYYPDEFPPAFDPSRDSPMLREIEELFNSKAEADAASAEIEALIKVKNEQKAFLGKCKQSIALVEQPLLKPIKDQLKVVNDTKAALATKTSASDRREWSNKVAEAEKKLSELKDLHQSKLDELKQMKNSHDEDIKRLDADIVALRAAQQPLAPLNAQAELLVKDLIKVDEKTPVNALTSFIRAERLQALMNDNTKNTGWLKLRVVIAGGNTRVKTNLFTDVFNGGNRVWYNGGSVVEYHLYDRTGRSILSDTVNNYLKYRKPKDMVTAVDTHKTQHNEH
jgi:hypothetical protein